MEKRQKNDRFHIRRAAVVVCLADGYTGEPPAPALLKAVSVTMTDGSIPVKKPEGYWVFWENGSRYRTVVVESPWFEREEQQLDMELWKDEPERMLEIWLRPGPAYPYPASR